MVNSTHRMSQPGRTGNLGVLRIVKSAQRTGSSVDPIGRRSVVVILRSVGSSLRSSTLRFPPPVSMALRTIETGGAKLAQRQSPWAFAATRRRCKSPEIRLCGHPVLRLRPAADPRSLRRSSRAAMQSTAGSSDPSAPLSKDSREIQRYGSSAAGAPTGLTLNRFRIDPGRNRGDFNLVGLVRGVLIGKRSRS